MIKNTQHFSSIFTIQDLHRHHLSSRMLRARWRVLRGAKTAREDADPDCSRAILVEYDDGNFRLENRRLIFLTFSHFWP